MMKRQILILSIILVSIQALALAKTTRHVPSLLYPKIQDAINASAAGDTVLILPGRHRIHDASTGDFTTQLYVGYVGLDITIRSLNPDDPCTVANTVIEGGFLIFSATRDMVINGLTIEGRYFGWRDGCNGGDTAAPCDANYPANELGQYIGDTNDPNNANKWIPGDPNGQNGWSMEGGGMQLLGNSSPIVTNCVFNNCVAEGRDGGNSTQRGWGGWAGWGHGGAVYVGPHGNPLFKNCDFIDCYAIGGDGGNNTSDGGRGGSWGSNNELMGDPATRTGWKWAPADGYGEIWRYSGLGGAVYCDEDGTPVFDNCNFVNNKAIGGSCGLSDPEMWSWPQQNYKIERHGGAVFCAANSAPDFNNCTFIGNEPDPNNNTEYSVITHKNGPGVADNPYIGFGGAVAYEDGAAPKFTNCIFNDNTANAGGAVFNESGAGQFSKCSFEDNSALVGGGICMVNSTDKIAESQFSGNKATTVGGGGGGIYVLGGNTMITDSALSDNTASSGGAIYIDSGLTTLLRNCLITGNSAGSDGGGISTTWDSNPTIANCTIADNSISGAGGYGGGVNVAYGGFAQIINSIIWGNSAGNGNQIAIGSNGLPPDENIIVSYSNVQDGAAGVYFYTGVSPSYLQWDYNFNLTGLTDPLFIAGYYLSQPPDQTATSLCVNKGNLDANDHSLHMWRGTTSTSNKLDSNNVNMDKVDMGYHYVRTADIAGDYNFDGKVDIADLYLYSEWSGSSGCDFPYWCDGRDLNQDGTVNGDDYNIFAANWGGMETTPPSPNPMTWAVLPYYVASPVSVKMKATTAIDNSGFPVQYGFQRTNAIGANDGPIHWSAVSDANYTDTTVVAGSTYGYKVMAHDVKPAGMAVDADTAWSVIGYVVASLVSGVPTTPSGLTATPVSATQINLAWTDNSNNETGFKIERQTGGGSFSQIAATGTNVKDYNDASVSPSTTYTYRVRAYNGSGDSTYSNSVTVTTGSAGQGPTAPSNLTATGISDTQINLSWTDNSSDETGFKIERQTGGGSFSQIATVGTNVTTYNNTGLTPGTTYSYRVRAYNGSGDSAYSNTISASTPQLPTPTIWYDYTRQPVDGNNSGQTKTDPNGTASSYWWHKIVAPIQTTPVVYYRFVCTSQSGFSSPWFPSSGIDAITHDLSPIGSGNPNPRVIYGTNAITYCVPVSTGTTGMSLNWRVDVSFNRDGSGTQNHSATKTIYAP